MYQKFENLPDDKRQRIINAASEEFSRQGYKNASTNAIVRMAGISKGSLFHYFPTKRDLYLYVFDHLSQVMISDFYRMKDFDERELFALMRGASAIKLQLYRRYPGIYKFIMSAYFEEDPEVKADLQKRSFAIVENTYDTLFASVDTSRFRPDIDARTAFNIIVWSMEGLGKTWEAKWDLKNIDEAMFKDIQGEMEHYLQVLEKLIYLH